MQRTFHIVLNYRREDTSAHAGRLYDDLADQFGGDQVFMDIDAIEPGVDFAEVIEDAVGSASVFLSVIGPRWLSTVDAKGVRRLDRLDDFVRLEIEAALRPEVRVIPVLVQNATMPTSEELPQSLAPLARRNAIELRDNSWRYDVGRLIETIERVREGRSGEDDLGAKPADAGGPRRAGRAQTRPTTEAVPERKPRAWIAAAGIAAILALTLAIVLGVSRLSGSDGPHVRIEGVHVEMRQSQTSATKSANNVLVATASVNVRGSAPGVEYRVRFTLEIRGSPASPAMRVGGAEIPFVLDDQNDQCSCRQRFPDVTRGQEYRVYVEVFRANRPTAEPLVDDWSRWIRA
jgi:hypothetical protein